MTFSRLDQLQESDLNVLVVGCIAAADADMSAAPKAIYAALIEQAYRPELARRLRGDPPRAYDVVLPVGDLSDRELEIMSQSWAALADLLATLPDEPTLNARLVDTIAAVFAGEALHRTKKTW